MATKDYTEPLRALDKIEKTVAGQKAGTDVCATYAKIKPLLEAALPLIAAIPVYGPKIAAAIKFLMALADKVCAA